MTRELSARGGEERRVPPGDADVRRAECVGPKRSLQLRALARAFRSHLAGLEPLGSQVATSVHSRRDATGAFCTAPQRHGQVNQSSRSSVARKAQVGGEVTSPWSSCRRRVPAAPHLALPLLLTPPLKPWTAPRPASTPQSSQSTVRSPPPWPRMPPPRSRRASSRAEADPPPAPDQRRARSCASLARSSACVWTCGTRAVHPCELTRLALSSRRSRRSSRRQTAARSSSSS